MKLYYVIYKKSDTGSIKFSTIKCSEEEVKKMIENLGEEYYYVLEDEEEVSN